MVRSMEDIPPTKIIPAGGKARTHSTGIGWRRRSESNRCIEVLQTSALPLGYAAGPEVWKHSVAANSTGGEGDCPSEADRNSWSIRCRPATGGPGPGRAGPYVGAGNGSRTRDFNLGKVALYH